MHKQTLDPIVSIFLARAEPPYRKFGEVPPTPGLSLIVLCVHIYLTIGNHTTYCKHLVECV